MSRMELTLEHVAELDFGMLAKSFNQHLQRAATDCMDRSGDAHERKVILTFSLKPEKTQSGLADHVLVEAQVTSKVPAHRGRVHQCLANDDGLLLFESLSPDHVEQMSFEEEEARRKAKGETEDGN